MRIRINSERAQEPNRIGNKIISDEKRKADMISITG